MIENVVEYRYEQVAAKITQLIHRGTLRPGERIPSVRRISRQEKVSVSTALQAYFLLEDRGLIVLRNEVTYIKPEGAQRPVAIVGLDDEWSGAIDPDKAWDGVDPTLPIVCLNHNPANVRELLDYPWQWMLSGHTHGRQVGQSAISRRLAPKLFRHYTHGYYLVEGRHLYVNRGLSYGQRVLDWCRPEVTVFKLVAEEQNSHPVNRRSSARA